jgi:hypothetical protein
MNRCPGCRTRRATLASLLNHVATSGHTHCGCGGYHYRHRPGSPLCERNPMAQVRQAARQGEPLELLQEIEAHCAWEGPGRPLHQWPSI